VGKTIKVPDARDTSLGFLELGSESFTRGRKNLWSSAGMVKEYTTMRKTGSPF